MDELEKWLYNNFHIKLERKGNKVIGIRDLCNDPYMVKVAKEPLRNKGGVPVEPVQLEVLTPEEMSAAVPNRLGRYEEYRQIAQATIVHNEAKGQLYRVKE